MDVQKMKMRIVWISAVCLLALATVILYKCTHTCEEKPAEYPEEIWRMLAQQEAEEMPEFRFDGRFVPFVVDSLTGGTAPDRGVLTLDRDMPDSLWRFLPGRVGQYMVFESEASGFTGMAEIYRMEDLGVGIAWFYRKVDIGQVLQDMSVQLDSIARSFPMDNK